MEKSKFVKDTLNVDEEELLKSSVSEVLKVGDALI